MKKKKNIEHKYKVGDVVTYIRGNEVREGKVTGVIFYHLHKDGKLQLKYFVDFQQPNDIFGIEEDRLFGSKEEFINSL